MCEYDQQIHLFPYKHKQPPQFIGIKSLKIFRHDYLDLRYHTHHIIRKLFSFQLHLFQHSHAHKHLSGHIHPSKIKIFLENFLPIGKKEHHL